LEEKQRRLVMEKSQVQYGPVQEFVPGRPSQEVKLPWEKKFHRLGGKSKESLAAWVQKYVDEAFARKEARQAQMAQRREKAKADRIQAAGALKNGDIFVASWGYDQTNVDFYQVVGVFGKMAELRPIKHKSEGHGEGYSSMSDHVVPVKDSFIGEGSFKIIQSSGNGKAEFSFSSYKSAYAWDGTPRYSSWYA
jgi:hypothetical protein